MEFEVRAVGGIESCFVSLPLSLIQTLQSTSSGVLPPILALELRSRNNDLWHVAWSGSASMSSAIEVAQQFSECMSLPDHTAVQVRAVANVPKATLVSIEPNSEDDWEVLELNSEHAETAILKQVGIAYEGMKFPLWLLGHTVVLFLVVSTFPKNSVGTEVAVAPKRRKKNVDSYKDSYIHASENKQFMAKALLRVQDPKERFIQRSEIKGVMVDVMLTSAVFIHPETADKSSFSNLQLVVIIPRLPQNENVKNRKNGTLRKKSSSMAKEGINGVMADKDTSRHLIARLLFSDLVSKGHIMLPLSLRLYLRAGLHSRVYVKRCNMSPEKDILSLKVSPCRFKMFGNNESEENDSGVHERIKYGRSENLSLRSNLITDADTMDWSIHEAVAENLSCGPPIIEDEESPSLSSTKKGIQDLLRAWFIGQRSEIASNTGMNMNSLVLGNETLLHFRIKGYKIGIEGKDGDSLERRNLSGEQSIELVYLLTISGLQGDWNGAYVLDLNEENMSSDSIGAFELPFRSLEWSKPVYFDSVKERTSEKFLMSTISSLSWMGTATSDVVNRLTVLLSPTTGKLFSTYNFPLPGHVLIYGPAGSGKSSLARAVAKSLEEDEEILSHTIFISCSRLASEKAATIRQSLSGCITEALDHSPSLIIFDDLDIIVPSSDSEGSQPSTSVVALVQFLTDIMDEYGEKRQTTCGIGPIAFIASVQSLGNLPQPLSASGRFDFHVQLNSPAALERGAILKHEVHKRSLQCSDDILSDIASKCDGYDAYDLETLVDRAVHSAVGRILPSHSGCGEYKRHGLLRDDFSQAMNEFLPVAMRDITKSASEGGRIGWEDVGGFTDIRNAIQEMVELPSKFTNIFAQAPLRLRSNVLLYGPPGCGKTHIVGAAAAACSLRFISVKGPELLNKYIGASEQAVRDIFSKAAAAAPCLLFFDEFDSIAPKRGHDNTGVTDRVVNQLLTELDGVEVLTGVFVFAATSRPDLLDAALLRPGRLDRLLFCDFPSWHERVDILKVLSRKLPLAVDVDLDTIASQTEGFSGADLQALLSDAQLASVHQILESGDNDRPGKMPVITDALLKSVASRARPSVSEAEKRRLYGIYSQFLDSKRSVAARSRDAKGKKATLA